MLAAVSSLQYNIKDERGGDQMDVGFTIGGGCGDEFPDFSDENLLESIDFDDLFVGMDDGDVLPDLEMDSENILADYPVSGGEDSSDLNTTTSLSGDGKSLEDVNSRKEEEEEEEKVSSGSGFCNSGSCLIQGDEIVSKRDDQSVTANHSQKESERGRKSSSGHSKNSQGKRKVKVDWTPELHRRFVQAVEQLGVDKAVPSRILELMGIDCLTRHNIASHLQKYRSHRKHLLAREAEAASWSQRRQMYGGGTALGGGGSKRDMSPWLQAPPTMGFPPMPQVPHFRPLHVWGHPPMDRPLMPVWPKHIAPLPSPPPHVWAPPPSPHPSAPPNPSFWHSHHQRQVPNTIPPGAPYFPQQLAPTRYPTPPPVLAAAPGIPPPPHSLYKVDSASGGTIPIPIPMIPTAPPTGPSCPHSYPPFDFHPSKESIDAAIGDILSKPWQPLPLGLKPPALDSVLVELQRQGIQKVPPAAACVS